MVKVQCIRANCKLQIEPTSDCRKVKFIEEEDWCRKEEKTVGFVVGNISCGKVKEENKAFFAGQVSRWDRLTTCKSLTMMVYKIKLTKPGQRQRKYDKKTNRMTAPEGNLIPE